MEKSQKRNEKRHGLYNYMTFRNVVLHHKIYTRNDCGSVLLPEIYKLRMKLRKWKRVKAAPKFAIRQTVE